MIYIDDMGSMGFVQVGDGDSDHYCWQRPEDMTTSREAYAVTKENPGSDLAAETAAAMAAASIAFRKIDPVYSSELLRHAREVYLTFFLFTLKFFLIFCYRNLVFLLLDPINSFLVIGSYASAGHAFFLLYMKVAAALPCTCSVDDSPPFSFGFI
jgi:hypothetical protein